MGGSGITGGGDATTSQGRLEATAPEVTADGQQRQAMRAGGRWERSPGKEGIAEVDDATRVGGRRQRQCTRDQSGEGVAAA